MSTQPNSKATRHPIFARLYARMSVAMEREVADNRRALLEGLRGRVIEVGAGNDLNFRHHPSTVEEVVAVEPEPYLRGLAVAAAEQAPVPVRVLGGAADHLPVEPGFDAGVASLVLCSVPDQAAALAELFRVIRPGGELRFFEHVLAPEPGLARVQRLVDPVWHRIGGGCHAGATPWPPSATPASWSTGSGGSGFPREASPPPPPRTSSGARTGPAADSRQAVPQWREPTRGGPMRRVLRDHALSLTMFAIFLVTLVGMSIAGHLAANQQDRQHGQPPESYGGYVASGAFAEATFENWESEFLQLASYVFFTAFLLERGSPESKRPSGDTDADPHQARDDPDAPAPTRRGGLTLRLYSHSLSLALLALFLLSWLGHALGGHAEYNQQQLAHGAPPISLWGFVTSSTFWFQSLQNWQSEFLAVAALAVLGIFLRERGSPESKPVEAPHRATGSG